MSKPKNPCKTHNACLIGTKCSSSNPCIERKLYLSERKIAAMERAMLCSLRDLEFVLCDPEMAVSIGGSPEDRRITHEALQRLREFTKKGGA